MADIKLALIKDSKIGDITDRLDFAVVSGAANNTYNPFSAVSSSASSIVYNVQIPSESIVISREVLQQSTVSFTLAVSNVQPATLAFNYGLTDALAAFPLSALYTTMTATINNTNVSVNLQDVLPSLLRMNNSRELYKYNSFTPSFPDQAYLNYRQSIAASNSPLASWGTQSQDVDLAPRGAFPLDKCEVQRYVNGVYTDNSPISTSAATNTWKIAMTVTLTEPLFLSPFIFGSPEYNASGMAGINTISANFNIDSTCKRFFSKSQDPTGTLVSSVSLGGQFLAGQVPAFQSTRLLLQFLSTQPSDMVPSRVVSPYHDFPRYLSLSTNSAPIAAWAGGYAAPSRTTISSQNIQLNQLPDYFIISARIPMSNQTIFDTNSFLTINSISVNLNNQSGLLSSAQAVDLWKISAANGSTQSWSEFSGRASAVDTNSGAGVIVPTTGSLLILSPPKDLSLPDYLTSSSIGQFNFQFQLGVSNYYSQAVAPEICVIAVNSGVFVSQMGSSNIYTGVITKQMCLDAKEQPEVPAISTCEYKRMVGGNMGNRVSSAIGKMTQRFRKGMAKMPVMMGAGETGGRLARHFR